MAEKGNVYIIGAGPGDYKLITLKAIECIAKSDVIVYDRLIGSKILDFAKEGAELVYVGKMPDCHAVPQDEINRIIVAKALEGKKVARVKGGDPFVFGRGGEEAEALVENGITFEIIPGITSSIAVPAYAGIPVTHRDFCSSLHIITGHERPDKEDSQIDYASLAKVGGTLVFLMGVKNLPDICSNLIKNGKDTNTPAAIIERGTTSSQRVITGSLKDISEKAVSEGVKSPAITVIGDVAALREKLQWFPQGKLAGKKVIVTRSRQQASKLVIKIEELGGEAIEFPTIKIAEPENYIHFDKVLNNLESYRWLVFTSVNGVTAFFKRMRLKNVDIRRMASTKVCAVGAATAEELASVGIISDYMPETYTTEELLKGLLERVGYGEKVLLARADIASKELSDGLKANGIDYEDLIAYKTLINESGRDEALELLGKAKADYITFTSSSTVQNFISIIGEKNIHRLANIKVLCIGPVTEKTARELGVNVTAVADVFTIDGLVDKLLQILEV